MATDYESLLTLRNSADASARGYMFEQWLRESVPWDTRPPIALSIRHISEQLDAIFEWRGQQFLLEAKAKRDTILRGSRDWEDFELKIRRRQGGVIGLFCSLSSVAESVIQAAEQLNQQHFPAVVLAGDLWDDLSRNAFPLSDILRYMMLHVRADFRAVPPRVSRVRDWLYDRDATIAGVEQLCGRESALFLRRHEHDRHQDLYVERAVDRDLIRATELLRPSSLSRLSRRKAMKDGEDLVIRRDAPPQICILRDSSGAGKTTLAVQMARGAATHFAVAHAALEPEVDRLDAFLDSLGPNRGFQSLLAADRPLMVIIDSLDEARTVPSKHQEVLSLLKLLDELNKSTQQVSRCFPVLLVFTIREDYWERWATLFEGRHTVVFRQYFSLFNAEQLRLAIERYSAVYGYRVDGTLSPDALAILATPFNLQVFSEANKRLGTIRVTDALPHNVLSLYFARKRADVLRRNVDGFGSTTFMLVCARLGMLAACSGNVLKRQTVVEAIREVVPLLDPLADDVILALLSDQILVRDTETAISFRMRHSRFIEYLAAYYVVRSFDVTGADCAKLDELTNELFASPNVSMFRVHECIRFIAKSEFPTIADALTTYYANSDRYMSSNLGRLRAAIAYGGATSPADLALIFRSTATQSALVSWETVFVLAAKANDQPVPRIIDAFVAAWYRNDVRTDRWRLLMKIAERGAIMDEQVVKAILQSTVSREWEVFLGQILELNDRSCFARFWCDAGGPPVEKLPSEIEWRHVRRLLQLALENHAYVKGDVL